MLNRNAWLRFWPGALYVIKSLLGFSVCFQTSSVFRHSCLLFCLAFSCLFWLCVSERLRSSPFLEGLMGTDDLTVWGDCPVPVALRPHCTAPAGTQEMQGFSREVWFPVKAIKWIDYSCILLAAPGTPSKAHHHRAETGGYTENKSCERGENWTPLLFLCCASRPLGGYFSSLIENVHFQLAV